ncbi:MAG: hypothetical protein HY324_01680 [Chlamydiia bacterium]|nr:hypothetical protein [Chlamydiia bacterium]
MTPISCLKNTNIPLNTSKKKTVSFNSKSKTFLIPTRKEYISAGLFDALWWKEEDIDTFREAQLILLLQAKKKFPECRPLTLKNVAFYIENHLSEEDLLSLSSDPTLKYLETLVKKDTARENSRLFSYKTFRKVYKKTVHFFESNENRCTAQNTERFSSFRFFPHRFSPPFI